MSEDLQHPLLARLSEDDKLPMGEESDLSTYVRHYT
jgi:hypothetical protein